MGNCKIKIFLRQSLFNRAEFSLTVISNERTSIHHCNGLNRRAVTPHPRLRAGK